MHNFTYNAKEYLSFSRKELAALFVTAFFASFIFTFTNWGEEAFDAAKGLSSWGLVLLFLFFAFAVTLFACKLIALRIGYTLRYDSNIPGLLVGLVITVATAGYLPIFIPGGFRLDRPTRLKLGHWRGHFKGWEVGLISAAFPLLLLAWTLVFNPLYLLTGHEAYLELTVAVLLTALYSMIPFPGFTSEKSGAAGDWWQYLSGTSFGLEIWYASGAWWTALSLAILLYCAIVYLMTLLGSTVGIVLYLFTIPLAAIAYWVYRKFLSG